MAVAKEFDVRRGVTPLLEKVCSLADITYWFEPAPRQKDGLWSNCRWSDLRGLFGDLDSVELNQLTIEVYCERYIHQGDRWSVLKVLKEFQGGLRDRYALEYRFLHPSGEVRWLHSCAERIAAGSDTQYEAIGILQDVTAVREASLVAAVSKAQLEHVHQSARIGYWYQEREARPEEPWGMAVHCSAGIPAITGLTTSEIWSLNDALYISKYVHAGDRPALEAAMRAYEQSGVSSYDVTYRFCRPDGQELYLRSRADTMVDPDSGRRVRYGTLQDVTEEKRHEVMLIEARRQAEQAAAVRSALLSNISHELRTPLNAVVGFSDLLCLEQAAGRHLKAPHIAEYVGFIREAGSSLLQMVNNVLEFVSLDTGRPQLYPAECSIRGAVVAVCSDLAEMSQKRGLDLSAEIEPASLTHSLDERAFRIVLRHLVHNALRFAPEETPVVVQAMARPDGRLELVVRDEGVGIEDDVIAALGSPFLFGGSTYCRGGVACGGIGLGLAIVKLYVEAMGGEIRITNGTGQASVAVLFP